MEKLVSIYFVDRRSLDPFPEQVDLCFL
jgi:hypothetical protein